MNFWLGQLWMVGGLVSGRWKEVECSFFEETRNEGKWSDLVSKSFKLVQMEKTPLLSKEKRCPEKKSWFLSRITFSWFTPLVFQGKRNALKQCDLWNLDPEKTTVAIVQRFEQCWKKDKTANSLANSYEYQKLYSKVIDEHKDDQENDCGIFRPMVKAFWWEFFLAAVYCLIAACLQFVGPLVLSYLIAFVAGEGPEWLGWLCVASIFLSSVANSIFNAQHEYLVNVLSMKMRSCMIHAIYKKSLMLSTAGRKDFTVGEIVNLMAVDTQKIVDFIPRVNLLWSGPFQIAVSTYLLWKQLGVACFAGLAVMILMVPFVSLLNAQVRKYQMKVMGKKDRRAKLMNELLNGIKVVKLFAWEDFFRKSVFQIRKKEVSLARVVSVLTAVILSSFTSVTFFVSLASFGTFVLIDERNVLDPTKVFVSLSLINVLRIPLNTLLSTFSYCIMAMVAVRRINKYLISEENNQSNVSRDLDGRNAIIIKEGTFTWEQNLSPVLKDIHLIVPHGKLVAVVGEVGSGKSSLLAAILGLLEKKSGHVNVNGSLAYVPQQAWILNETVRQNILFVKPLDRIKYESVLEACALEPDLKILKGGDMCEIGEKGINLSGGQKQRVSLARAVYLDADIYLLDDPLSAVDSHVSKHLFDKVIGPKGLLKAKTRVLVSHRLTVLPNVDQIIVLKNGRIVEQGTYLELLERRGDFAQMIFQCLDQEMDIIEDAEEMAIIEDMLLKVGSEFEQRHDTCSNISSKGSLRRSRVYSTSSAVESGQSSVGGSTVNLKGAKLIENEGMEKGSIKWSVYKDYFKAMGYFQVILTIFIFLMANGLEICQNLWLSFWSNDYIDPSVANNTHQKYYRLNVFTSLGLIEVVFIFTVAILIAVLCLKAAARIHNLMLDRVLFAPMLFFDTTPLGRIQNRFTSDLDTLDLAIQRSLLVYIQTVLLSIVKILLACVETPWSILLVLPLGYLYIILQKYYIATARQLRRIESVTKSLIYSHFLQTVNGIDSIHAYGVSDVFVDNCYKRVDSYHAANYMTIVAGRWLSIRLGFLGNAVVTLAATFAVLNRESLTPGIVGLSVSVAMSLTATLNLMVRTSTNLETNSVSVERCIEYKDVPVEAARHIELKMPQPSWPEEGQIRFVGYSTRYRAGLDLVLKNVTFDIEPGQKVGVVGRTGAGKSSLTLALFRIIEPVSGRIIIDNVDITQIGLHDLRSRLTIIPQDPVLFSGTIRMNLDPCNENSSDDETLWRALDLAHLGEFVRSTLGGLSFEIAEGGENLSAGQRQLLCLARAILRRSKILVLDEATAAVDVETDELIQKTIRSEFKDCTVLTIAHRLNTVMDYDKILVLSNGEVLEYDSPTALLENTNSVFHGMAKDANLV